ncbi:MAG: S41 family peptidase [Clostridia bacterium]|nr:S41 family peptidase [Clostridia bacterium]
MKKQFSLFQVLLFSLLAASVTLVLTFYATESRIVSRLSSVSEAQQLFSKLNEVKRCVDANFVGDYTASALTDGAVEGYINALGDKWSYYLTAEEYKATANNLSGGFTGIGVRVSHAVETDSMMISEVYKSSPAETAGLKAGDEIVAVDGNALADIGYEGAKTLLQGENGTAVGLSVLRDGERLELTLVRAYVREENVISTMLQGKIAYIRIKEYADGVDTEFEKQLQEMIDDGAVGYIFDMRNNGGGKLPVLLNILDRLLPEGVMFISEDRYGNREEYNSDAKHLSAPMTVLINRNTYSAAEYFAAVLQEYGKATVVGEKTTGKGYGQSTVKLSDGSALVISTIRYFTPQNRSLATTGCVPNVAVELADPSILNLNRADLARDAQLASAYALLGGTAETE